MDRQINRQRVEGDGWMDEWMGGWVMMARWVDRWLTGSQERSLKHFDLASFRFLHISNMEELAFVYKTILRKS